MQPCYFAQPHLGLWCHKVDKAVNFVGMALQGYEPGFHQATGLRVLIVRAFVPILAVLRCVLGCYLPLIS